MGRFLSAAYLVITHSFKNGQDRSGPCLIFRYVLSGALCISVGSGFRVVIRVLS